MLEVGERELKQRTSDILRRVREEHETVTVTRRGKAVARIVPVEDREAAQAEAEAIWARMRELSKEISASWPDGLSAVEAVREQRREF